MWGPQGRAVPPAPCTGPAVGVIPGSRRRAPHSWYHRGHRPDRWAGALTRWWVPEPGRPSTAEAPGGWGPCLSPHPAPGLPAHMDTQSCTPAAHAACWPPRPRTHASPRASPWPGARPWGHSSVWSQQDPASWSPHRGPLPTVGPRGAGVPGWRLRVCGALAAAPVLPRLGQRR